MSNDTTLTKVCSKCGIEKPATTEYFHRHSNGLHPRCKECRAEDDRKVREKRITNVYVPSEELKQCSKCQREFPATIEYFAWHKHSGALYSQCHECHRAARREERKRNDSRYTAFSQQWYQENREREQQKHRIHYVQNKQEYLERASVYQKENAVHVNLKNRLWYATPKGLRNAKVQRARRRASVKNAPGSHTAEDIGILYDEQEGRCAYCGITLHGVFHLDHIIPLIQGGSNNPDNLACACAACNLSKGEKLLEEWIAWRGW